ncbi:MAG: carboxylating nicotinate-nucleotide diphosphorylase [Planctomycetes bacterium]|nr:carboxylating nicotinate-nucleotide diphosphorylase [Planctomycetota bacterium]
MSTLLGSEFKSLVALAKAEDLGAGDITSAMLEFLRQSARFDLVVRASCVFCGREVVNEVAAAYDSDIAVEWNQNVLDGMRIDEVPATLAIVRGPLASILAAERVMLNFVQRLCGVATLTRKFVDAAAGTRAAIYDTRKTTPGWRALEKYAVRCGGGRNHRKGLFDAVLIKDNHLAGVPLHRLAPTVFEMLNRLPASGDAAKPFVEVEAASIEEVEELFKVIGIDAILLDNFSLDDIRRAAELRSDLGLAEKIEFEVSGGVKLQNVRAFAETGVERISVGAITHSATAVDMALERVA